MPIKETKVNTTKPKTTFVANKKGNSFQLLAEEDEQPKAFDEVQTDDIENATETNFGAVYDENDFLTADGYQVNARRPHKAANYNNDEKKGIPDHLQNIKLADVAMWLLQAWFLKLLGRLNHCENLLNDPDYEALNEWVVAQFDKDNDKSIKFLLEDLKKRLLDAASHSRSSTHFYYSRNTGKGDFFGTIPGKYPKIKDAMDSVEELTLREADLISTVYEIYARIYNHWKYINDFKKSEADMAYGEYLHQIVLILEEQYKFLEKYAGHYTHYEGQFGHHFIKRDTTSTVEQTTTIKSVPEKKVKTESVPIPTPNEAKPTVTATGPMIKTWAKTVAQTVVTPVVAETVTVAPIATVTETSSAETETKTTIITATATQLGADGKPISVSIQIEEEPEEDVPVAPTAHEILQAANAEAEQLQTERKVQPQPTTGQPQRSRSPVVIHQQAPEQPEQYQFQEPPQPHFNNASMLPPVPPGMCLIMMAGVPAVVNIGDVYRLAATGYIGHSSMHPATVSY